MTTMSKPQEPNIIWQNILMSLPKTNHERRGFLPHERCKFWSNGDEILCDQQDDCETVATFLEAVFGEELTLKIGYYDPEEDDRDSLRDENTGFYYITIE